MNALKKVTCQLNFFKNQITHLESHTPYKSKQLKNFVNITKLWDNALISTYDQNIRTGISFSFWESDSDSEWWKCKKFTLTNEIGVVVPSISRTTTLTSSSKFCSSGADRFNPCVAILDVYVEKYLKNKGFVKFSNKLVSNGFPPKKAGARINMWNDYFII